MNSLPGSDVYYLLQYVFGCIKYDEHCRDTSLATCGTHETTIRLSMLQGTFSASRPGQNVTQAQAAEVRAAGHLLFASIQCNIIKSFTDKCSTALHPWLGYHEEKDRLGYTYAAKCCPCALLKLPWMSWEWQELCCQLYILVQSPCCEDIVFT